MGLGLLRAPVRLAGHSRRDYGDVVPRHLPWEDGQSILELIRDWEGSGHAELVLPDEPAPDPTQIRWSAGSLGGVATRHPPLGEEASPDVASRIGRLAGKRNVPAEIVARLKRLVRDPADEERLALYWIAQNEEVLTHVNAVLELLVADRDLLEAAGPHARWLVREARHRDPLKLGIALLGVCGEPEDAETLKTLARHDEFTLYCSVSLTNILPGPVDALWEVAKSVEGWGKIEAVERLAARTGHRPEVRRWLLTDGCENSVMNEYLGYACATAGGLAEALAGEVDDELLDGACTITSALCTGGPAEDLDDYAEGPIACKRLLEHLEERCSTLERLATVIDLVLWLERDGTKEEPTRGEEDVAGVRQNQVRLREHGWSDELRRKLRERCRTILAQPRWPEQIRRAFESGEHPDDWIAWRAARHVGVDLWEAGFRKLQSGPLDDWLVYKLIHVRDIERQKRVITWAEEHLPLDRVASGPELHLFPAAEISDIDSSLISIVQEMREGELYSEPLVAAALRAPVIPTRNMGLNALESRPRERWGRAVEEALDSLREEEPDPRVRERVFGLIG